MSIADLQPGQSATIFKVGGDGPIRRRLLDMGLTPGTRIKMLQPAPSGDPVSIFIRSFELSLRRQEALNVEILDIVAQEDVVKNVSRRRFRNRGGRR